MWGATAIFAMPICQYYFQFVNVMISTLLQSIASASFHYRRLWSGMRGRLEVATMFVFVFVKQLTCHPSRRLGQTVPCPPRVGSLGAAQLEGLARVLYQPQPRVQTGLAEVEAAYHRKLHSDLEETKRAAISASELPSLSCGSGEDFKNMNALDRYDKLLRSGGLVAKSSQR